MRGLWRQWSVIAVQKMEEMMEEIKQTQTQSLSFSSPPFSTSETSKSPPSPLHGLLTLYYSNRILHTDTITWQSSEVLGTTCLHMRTTVMTLWTPKPLPNKQWTCSRLRPNGRRLNRCPMGRRRLILGSHLQVRRKVYLTARTLA